MTYNPLNLITVAVYRDSRHGEGRVDEGTRDIARHGDRRQELETDGDGVVLRDVRTRRGCNVQDGVDQTEGGPPLNQEGRT